jgi:hypothetical protein
MIWEINKAYYSREAVEKCAEFERCIDTGF